MGESAESRPQRDFFSRVRLGRWSPTALMLAGVVSIVGYILAMPAVFFDWYPPVGVPFIIVGLTVLPVGLIGLYLLLVKDATPTALTGFIFAAIAATAWFALIVIGVTTAVTGLTLSRGPLFLGIPPSNVVFMSMYGGYAVAFLMSGIAVWQSAVASRVVAGLLVIGGLAWLWTFSVEFLLYVVGIPERLPVYGIGYGVPVLALIVGYLLRRRLHARLRI